MFTVEEIWEEQERQYNQLMEEDEQYCHPESFRWGFEHGFEYALKKLGWHPASKLPVIPEGKNWVKVVALVDFGDNTLRPRHEIYKDKGWSKKDMWTVKWWCYPPEDD